MKRIVASLVAGLLTFCVVSGVMLLGDRASSSPNRSRTINKEIPLLAGQTIGAFVSCPQGFEPTGGGWYTYVGNYEPYFEAVGLGSAQHPLRPDTWGAAARNDGDTDVTFGVQVICRRS